MSIHHTFFIHCADIHLDSPMESHLSPLQAQERRREILLTFSRMIDYASQHEVRGILISGDLFDTNRCSVSTRSTLFHMIEQHPEIDFLYIPGNHDMHSYCFLSSDMDYPTNLYIFSSDATSDTDSSRLIRQRQYQDIVITGLTGDISQLPSLSDNLINIVMLHGQIDTYKHSDFTNTTTDRTDATSSTDSSFHYSLRDLSGKHIDYVAAGHIHKFQSEKIDNRGIYCYSGCLEGRGFDECGEKGFVLLDISTDSSNKFSSFDYQFIPFANRQLFDIEIDVSETSTYDCMEQQVTRILSDIDNRHLVRLKLTGFISPDRTLHADWILQKFSEDFYLLRVEDHTHPRLSYQDYQYDNSLKGEFIRLVLSDSDLSDNDKENIIMEGLRALSGEEILLVI